MNINFKTKTFDEQIYFPPYYGNDDDYFEEGYYPIDIQETINEMEDKFDELINNHSYAYYNIQLSGLRDDYDGCFVDIDIGEIPNTVSVLDYLCECVAYDLLCSTDSDEYAFANFIYEDIQSYGVDTNKIFDVVKYDMQESVIYQKNPQKWDALINERKQVMSLLVKNFNKLFEYIEKMQDYIYAMVE